MSYSIPDTKPAKAKAAKIPRPMNAFMIFAREHRPRVKKENPNEENHVISIRLGNLWSSLSSQDKDHYQELSREAANEHRRKYPDYRYEPKPKIKKKRRYDHYLLMDKMRTAAAQAAKEEKEKAEVKPRVITSTTLSIPTTRTMVTYTAPQPTLVSGPPRQAPQIQAYHPEESSQYPKGFYYSTHPNLIPAHSQPARGPHGISYGSNPYMSYHLPGDAHYMNQPLDMSTAKKTETTTDKSGKVYCELTTQSKQASVPHVQNWMSGHPGYPSPWGDQSRMTSGQINPRPVPSEFPPPMFSKTSGDQTASMSSSRTAGDGKTELVWIPCEPDFAKKMGWALDPCIQQRSACNNGQQ